MAAKIQVPVFYTITGRYAKDTERALTQTLEHDMVWAKAFQQKER